VALTGLYAMQHFTKNRHETLGLLMDRARYHRARVEALTQGEGDKRLPRHFGGDAT
jgi:hypothetical protein